MSGSIKSGGGIRKPAGMALDVRTKLEEAFGFTGSSKELATLHAETFALNLKVSALYEGLLSLTDKVEEVLAYIHHDKDSITSGSGSASGKESLDTFESIRPSPPSLPPPGPSAPTAEQSSELMTALTQPEEPRRMMMNRTHLPGTAPVAAPPRPRRQPAGRKSGVRPCRPRKVERSVFDFPPTDRIEPGPSSGSISLPVTKAGRPRKAKQVVEVEVKETRVKSPIATRSRSRTGPIKLTFPKNIFRTVEAAVAEGDESPHPKVLSSSLPADAAEVLLEHNYVLGEASVEEPSSGTSPKVEVGEADKAGESSNESDDEMPLAIRQAPSVERTEAAGSLAAEVMVRGKEGEASSSKKRKHEEAGTPFSKRTELLTSLIGKEAPSGADVGIRKGVQKSGLEQKSGNDAHRKWEAFVQSEIKKLMERKEWPDIMSKTGFTFHKIIQGEASPIFDKIMASSKGYCEAEKMACPSAQNVAYVISSFVKSKTSK